MASNQISQVAILPFQPRYAQAIVTGKKKVEFRRRSFRRAVRYIVIYVSSPIKKIIGFFRISHITKASPAELWEKYRDIGGMEERAFQAYYKGAKYAVAIGIDEFVPLKEPIALESLCSSLSPPQSFTYLPNELFDFICH